MKANELRIGNWVYNDLKQECTVCGLSISGVDGTFSNTGFFSIFNPEPIPLTEEWLLKFGFVMREESYHKFPTIRNAHDRTKIVDRLDRVYFIYDEQADDWRKLSVLVILDPSTLKIRSIGVNGVRNKFIVPADIRSVHQLQNLYFALTGEELEIK